MAAQLPTCSPGLIAQQHMYPIAHSTSGGQYTSQSDTSIRNNDSLICPTDMFKDISLNIRPNSENITSDLSNHEKLLSHQNHRQFSSEKRPNANNNCVIPRFSSCSEINKHNNMIHDQHLFDEYVRIYGEDGNFRSWSDNSLPTTSTSSFQNAQHASIPLRCANNIMIYEEQQTQADIPAQEFSDCRLELSWKRNHLNQIATSNNNSNFINSNQSLVSSKNELKECRDAHIRINDIANKASENLGRSDSIVSKGHFDYQALSTGQFPSVLPYLHPPNYQHPLNDQLMCQGPSVTTNIERSLSNDEEELSRNENERKKSMVKEENKQIQATTLLTLNTPQTSSVLNVNAPLTSTVQTPNILQSSSVLNVNTTQSSSAHAANALQTSSANNDIITTQVSLALTENIPQSSTSHIFNSIQSASIQNAVAPLISSIATDNVPHISSIQVITPQISLTHPIKNASDRDSITQDNLKHSCSSNSDGTSLSIPLPISKAMHASTQSLNLSIDAIAPPLSVTTNDTTTSSHVKIVMASESSESVPQMHQDVSSVQKFQKDNVSKGQEHIRKASSDRPINIQVSSEIGSCCLLCGIAVEASSHCLIDNLITVPSKISVSEKLSHMVGFPIPRDFLPSLYICPKCFHLINEVDVLEHRLNICRREVMFSIEQILERNGIHISPYKRYQRQQCIVPFQVNEMQFPHYQQPTSGACLHANFQNEGYQITNHGYTPQNQPHLITDSLPSQSCEVNVTHAEHHSSMQVHGHPHENNFHLQVHDHNSHHIQSHYPIHQEISNQQLPVHHNNSSQNGHQKGSQIQITMEKIQNVSEDCKQQQQQQISHIYNCDGTNNHTGLSLQNSHPILINSSHHLHQIQLPRSDGDKLYHSAHPSCEVELPLNHLTHGHKKLLSKNHCQQPNSLQDLSRENLGVIGKSLSKNVLMSQSHTNPPSVEINQKPTALLDIDTTVTLEPGIENKAIEQQGSLVNGTPCQVKNDDVLIPNTNTITNNNNQDIYFSHQNHDNLISRPMSMLLSTYIQPDSREFNTELIVLNRLNLEKDTRNLQEKNDPSQNDKIPITEKDFVQDLHENSVVSDENWTNNISNNNELALDSINGNGMNPKDCEIDIEKCDVKADLVKESISNISISSTTKDKVKMEANTSKERNVLKSNNVSRDNKNVDSISQVNEIMEVNAGVNHINSLSPSGSGLEMFFSPSSPPPPPEGPPEGLRNVQDATEYHKPTLLGKNLKVKKHAKLQICRQCDQVFSNRQALIRHIERRHKTYLTYFTCDTCHRKFNSERTLKHHLQSHKTYPCKFCDKIFLKKVKLKKHLEEHTKKNLVCEICKKETGSMQALISHMKTHERTPKSFICSICSKIFTCKRNLDHHSRIHSGEKPFSCLNCSKRFRHRSNMVAHHKLCSGTLIFLCSRPKCGKVFALKSLFERHIAEHDGNYAHLCSICNKGFGKSSDLLYHFATHGEVSTTISKKCNTCVTNGCNAKNYSSGVLKNIVCPICGKVILRKDSLQDHLAFHEGKRNYHCEKCSASFIYRSNLFFHVKTVHWLQRPYTCNLCHKTFTNSGSHKLHLRTHSGERPFQCDSCGKTFTSRGNYNRHLKCHVFHDHGSVESCSDSAAV